MYSQLSSIICPTLCARKGTNYCRRPGFGAQVMSIHSTYFALLHFLGAWAGVIPRNCQWNVKEFNMLYVFILGGVRGMEHEHADSERLCMNMPTQWAVFRSHCAEFSNIYRYMLCIRTSLTSNKWRFERASPNIGAWAPGGFPRGFSGFVLVFIWSVFLDVLRAAGQPWNMAAGVDATWCTIRGAKQRVLGSWRQIRLYIVSI